jgi:hypothetical protein
MQPAADGPTGQGLSSQVLAPVVQQRTAPAAAHAESMPAAGGAAQVAAAVPSLQGPAAGAPAAAAVPAGTSAAAGAAGAAGAGRRRRRKCAACGTSDVPRFKKCAGCDSTRYCSEQCQRVHWKKHRQVCGGAGGQPQAAAAGQSVSSRMTAFACAVAAGCHETDAVASAADRHP